MAKVSTQKTTTPKTTTKKAYEIIDGDTILLKDGKTFVKVIKGPSRAVTVYWIDDNDKLCYMIHDVMDDIEKCLTMIE